MTPKYSCQAAITGSSPERATEPQRARATKPQSTREPEPHSHREPEPQSHSGKENHQCMTVSGKELCGTAAALTEKELEQDLFALTRHVIYGVAPWLRPCCQVKVTEWGR